MALELLIFPAVVGGAFALKSIFKKKDDVFQEVFENRKIGLVKGKGKNAYMIYPKLVKLIKNDKNPFDLYLFRLPVGVPFNAFKQLKETFEDALGRDVDIKFKNKLAFVYVAKRSLPSKLPLKPLLDKSEKWNVLIGVNSFEAAKHDFDQYPHIVGGGTTRFGKTVLLKNIMVQLLRQNQNDARFWIIDLKGGVEFWEYEDLKQVRAVTSNSKEALHLLRKLNDMIGFRMKYFKRRGFRNIVDTPIKQRDFIIIDESHDLFKVNDNKKAKEIEYLVGRIASMGGAFGFRIIAFTQYPVKEAMPQFIKQNAPVRIGFQVADSVASRVIMDQGGLEELPGIPGRCMIKSFNYKTVQVPYIENHFSLVQHLERRKKKHAPTRKRREDTVEFG